MKLSFAATPVPVAQIPPCPGGVHTDLSHWPTVLITPPDRNVSDADFAAYLAWMERYVTTRGEPYAVVLDARRHPAPTPNQRRLAGEQMQRLKPFTERFCAGYAFVFESPLMRGVMTALFWLSKPDYPTKVFATREEALSWARAEVAKCQSAARGA